MNTPTIGIDPGKTGGLVIIWPDETPYKFTKIAYAAAEGMTYGMWETVLGNSARVAMEDVGSVPNDRPSAAFALGSTVGFWSAVLAGAGVKPGLIRPESWQVKFARAFGDRWCPSDRKERKKYIAEKVRTKLAGGIPVDLADAAALAWLLMEGII
jgi:hypothetical protein